jgi:hypothetical protein
MSPKAVSGEKEGDETPKGKGSLLLPTQPLAAFQKGGLASDQPRDPKVPRKKRASAKARRAR